MKYFTPDIMDFVRGADVYREVNIKARELYRIEYKKTREKLPKKFVKIYESHECFHDYKVPLISILPQYSSFTYGLKGKNKPSIVRLIFVGYDNNDLVWEIMLGSIKEIACHYLADFTQHIDCFIYDELLIDEDDNISWEMAFASGFNLKIVFNKLFIRELNKEEADKLRHPVKLGKRN